jgi:hypothetical protein
MGLVHLQETCCLDDLIDQNVGTGGTQQEINRTDDLDSANQDGTVQKKEVLTYRTDGKGPTSICEGIHKSKATLGCRVRLLRRYR